MESLEKSLRSWEWIFSGKTTSVRSSPPTQLAYLWSLKVPRVTSSPSRWRGKGRIVWATGTCTILRTTRRPSKLALGSTYKSRWCSRTRSTRGFRSTMASISTISPSIRRRNSRACTLRPTHCTTRWGFLGSFCSLHWCLLPTIVSLSGGKRLSCRPPNEVTQS